jgi:hypothetical protein
VLKKLIIILLAFVLGVAAWLFFSRKNSVIYRFTERGAVEYSGFVILNPFRDRGPEVAAEDVLSKLKSKDCDNALNLQEITPESREYICLRESWYPLTSWTLIDRLDEGHTRLIYRNYRGEMTDVGPTNDIHQSGPIEIDVYRTERGWVAMSYETYY